MEYLGTIYKGSQSDIIFPVPFIELSDGATVDFYTDGDGGFSRTKDEIKIDNYMLRTTASADELNSLNDGVLNYTINTCMGKSEGDTGLYLSAPTSYVDKQYLTADGVKTINGESIVGQGNIEIQGGGSEDYLWEWNYTPYFTGNTNFSEEELQSVIDAHNNGKNIIIKYNDLYIYPSIFEVHKTVLYISYMFNGDTYIFEYNSDAQSQNISKKNTSDTYVVSVDGENSLNNLTLTKDEIINLMAAVQANKNIILTNNEITYHVIRTNISNTFFKIVYGFNGLNLYEWTVSLNDYEVNADSQKTVPYYFQSRLGSNSWLTVKDLNLKNNKGVDNILTNLRKDIFISGFDLSKYGLNSTYTVDGNFGTIKSSFTTHQIKGIDTTGEIFNLDFRLKTDGTLAASYIHRDAFSNIDNKIYTFILSPNSDDNSKMNVQNCITSFDDIYDKINKTSDIFDEKIHYTEEDLNTLSGSVVNNYYTKTEVDDKIKNISGGTSDSETYIWEWGSLKTGDTTFTNEQITEIENAYNDGKNIILDLNGEKIYPNSFTLSKDGKDLLIFMYFLTDGNEYYEWEYFNYVDYDISGQTLELTKFMLEGDNVDIKCRTITTQGHGNLDTAITNLQKQIESGSSENLQNQINNLNQAITVEGDVRKKVDDELQVQINGLTDGTYTKEETYSKKEVDGKIPTSTSQLTNDSGYLTEHQSLEEYYTKSQCDANYETKGYSYSKAEIDTKIGDINNILESI